MASWIGTGGSNPGDVATSGNMGVGTSSPNAKLHVAGGDILIENGGNDRYLVFTQKSGANYGLHYENTAGSLTIWTNTNARLTVDNNGNVGIGKTNPGSRFAVAGLPTTSVGLTSGDIWRDPTNGNVLKVVP